MTNKELFGIFESHPPRKPMDETESKFLISILMNPEVFDAAIDDVNKTSEIYNHFKPLINSFQVQVFLKRLEGLSTVRMTLGSLILLSMQMETPGISVMLAFYIHHKLPENTIVDANILCEKLFPFGFFTEEQFHQIWDLQKVKKSEEHKGSDNWIDSSNLWLKF